MKKLITLISIIFIVSISYSQDRVGCTLQSIVKEFSDSNYLYCDMLSVGNITITMKVSEDGKIVHEFNSSYECIKTYFMPYDKVLSDKFKLQYDINYTILSSTSWYYISNERAFKIDMNYDNRFGWYFETIEVNL